MQRVGEGDFMTGADTAFAILRTNKIKDLMALRGASGHNSRRASKGTEHAIASAPRFDGTSKLLLGDSDALTAWKDRLAAVNLDPSSQRKDAVKAVELLLTASGCWFDQATDIERAEWVRRSLRFAEQKFGKANILSAHLHDDEATPHIHVLAVPLIKKTRARRGRKRKGREAVEPAQQQPTWGLSAKDFLGGSSAQHAKLQTTYWECVADLGLNRGVPKKETAARNLAPAKWRSLQAIEHDEIKHAAERAKADREKASETLCQAKASADALICGIEAISQGELQYSPKGAQTAAGGLKLTKTVTHPKLPQETEGLAQWRSAVRPFWKTMVSFARALSGLRRRQSELDCLGELLSQEREAHLRTASRQARHERKAGRILGQAQRDTQTILQAKERGARQR